MKNFKKLCAISMACAISILSIPNIGINTAYAAEQSVTKTATLNNAKVSFNGAEPREVQAYNIDGYNYVRVRDITNGLNMAVEALEENQIGVRIFPDREATATGNIERLTSQSINVKMIDGEIAYVNHRTAVKCFNYEGRYYFRVADIGVSSLKGLDTYVELTEIYASGGIKNAPPKDNYIAVSVNWNNSTGTIEVNRDTTDLWAVFNGKSGQTAFAKSSANAEMVDYSNLESTLPASVVKTMEKMENGTWQPLVPDFKKQAPFITAPEVGIVLANILVDDKIGAYNADGTLNEENIYPFYKYNSLMSNFGQCTWYVQGRFSEVNGVDNKLNKYWTGAGTVDNWLDNAENNNCPDVYTIRDINNIKPQSIAVFSGHVTFVEYVEYDANGKPLNVYYTEANTDHTMNGLEAGVYYPDFDCKVKVRTWEKWLEKGNGTLKGYIVAK